MEELYIYKTKKQLKITDSKRKILVYISGKYTADTPQEIARNIETAREANIKLWEAGYSTICPHMNTAHMEKDCNISWGDYIEGDLEQVRRSDFIYMLNNWKDSKGARIEREEAMNIFIPPTYSISDLEERVVPIKLNIDKL